MTAADLDAPIFVAGHRGLVGSALVRRLTRAGHTNLLTADRSTLDLRLQSDVDEWMADHRPHQVYLAAGTVGGVLANSTRPAEFLYDNMMIHATVVEAREPPLDARHPAKAEPEGHARRESAADQASRSRSSGSSGLRPSARDRAIWAVFHWRRA